MNIEILNSINRFSSNPSNEGFLDIIKKIQDPLEEEYFFISIDNQNKVNTFNIIQNNVSCFFENRLTGIKDRNKYTQVHFRILRFLISLAKQENKSIDQFQELKVIIDFLVYQDTTLEENQQLAIFTAELIIELPTKMLDDRSLKYLTRFSLSSNASFVGMMVSDRLFPRVIKEGNSEILLKLLDWFVFNVDAKQFNETNLKFTYDGFTASKMVNPEILKGVTNVIEPNSLLKFSLSKLSDAVKVAPFSFSHLSIPTIEESSQLLDRHKYELILVKFIRIQLELNELEQELIFSLFEKDHGIFNRLALYHINYFYDKNRERFWKLIDGNFLINLEVKHELFNLFQNNVNKISIDEFNRLIDSLTEMKDIVVNEKLSKEEISKFNARIAKEYLLAFTNCTTDLKSLIDNEIARITAIFPYEIEHPGYSYFFSQSVAYDKPRDEYSESFNTKQVGEYLTKLLHVPEKLEKNEAAKLARRINYIFRTNIHSILENSEILLENGIEDFYEIPSYYEKAWEDKVKCDWVKVFNFFTEIVNRHYWKNTKVYEGFIAYAAWLIRNITRDDSNPIYTDELISAKEFCLTILKLDMRCERLNRDPFMDILNSADGKIYEATINVLLRNARMNKGKDDPDKWFSDVKSYYTSVLDSGKQSDAMIWSITMYLPQFGYLDINWLKNNINNIFYTPNSDLWLLAMRCYHKFCKQVYKSIFDILEQNGHYEKALKEFTEGVPETDDVFQHVAISYVAGWEGTDIEDSKNLISRIINGGDRSQIHGLSSYFIRNENYHINKLLVFWKAVLNCKSIKDNRVFDDTLLLFHSIDEIDQDSFDLIKDNLKKITTNQVLFRFIHELFEKQKISPKYKAMLLLEIEEKDFGAFFKDEEFLKLAEEVKRLDPDFSKKFIQHLIEKRLFFLLDTYNSIGSKL